MSATDVAYFMGQGKAYIAPRVSGGALNGPFTYVGDVPMIGLSANQKFDDVEESTSGNRLVAAHIPIGLSYDCKIQCNQWSQANLTKAAYGGSSQATLDLPHAAASVTNEAGLAWGGGLLGLTNPGVSSYTATLGGAATTLQSIAVTAAGTGALAQGTSVALTFVGMTATVSPTAVAIIGKAGAIDHVEVTSVGSGVTVFPTSATITGVSGHTLTFNPGATALTLTTDYTVDATNGSVTFTSTSTKVPSGSIPSAVGINVLSNYSYASWTGKTEGVIQGIQEYQIRVQGLNTANGNSPVIITIWRFSMNIVKNLELIAAKHGTLELDGMMLPDAARDGLTQSQFYTIVKV